MSGLTGMPSPKLQDMFQVVNIDDAVAERKLYVGCAEAVTVVA